jgi:hypothetical protein
MYCNQAFDIGGDLTANGISIFYRIHPLSGFGIAKSKQKNIGKVGLQNRFYPKKSTLITVDSVCNPVLLRPGGLVVHLLIVETLEPGTYSKA